MEIRPYRSDTDGEQFRACVIELQDFEREIDPRMPPGEEIVDDYIVGMLFRCRMCDGQVLVADNNGELAGYVTILNRVQSDDLDDGNLEFGLIADLLVRKDYRGKGLGQKLLAAAESFAKQHGVQWLRISVMSENATARKLYAASGFSEIYLELEKDLSIE